MSYTALRARLLKKLDISSSALSHRARSLSKRDGPMSTRDATCLIAHDNGINVDRYLEPEELDRVHKLANSGSRVDEPRPKAAKRSDRRRAQEIKFPNDFRISGDLLPTKKLNEAIAMARVYPLLYVLENSVRDVVKRVMSDKYGEDWWDTELGKGKIKGVRDKALGRMESEEKKHAWHQSRGDHPIDYVDFGDLTKIIAARQQNFFPDVITDRNMFEHTIMKLVEPSRNVLCHMNPLDRHSISDIKSALTKWNRMISRTIGAPAKK